MTRGHGPIFKLRVDWEIFAGNEPHIAEGGSDKKFHSPCHVAI